LTVCTGSLFLGALVKLVGRRATTHWGSLATLKKLCADFPDGMATRHCSI
jgi:transcriptional regulator GlxA family with amidase domain